MSQPLQSDPDNKPTAPPVVVKKYANRRLYNTESSSYITLETLAEMVREGRDFVVYDAKTGDDITRGVLTQIIVEEENKGRAMLPTGFLRQLIGFYGDSVQTLVPRYLEQALSSFARQQEQMRQAVTQTMGSFFPFGREEVGRQNLAMMERAMSLFAPFAPRASDTEDLQPGEPPPPRDEVEALRAEVTFLRTQIASLQTGLAAAENARSGGKKAASAKE
jgi:polyhydroxyalkanoate synthesis repressor PhaR